MCCRQSLLPKELAGSFAQTTHRLRYRKSFEKDESFECVDNEPRLADMAGDSADLAEP